MVRDRNQHISQGLHQALHQLGLDKRMKQQQLIDAWPILVGENISRIAKAERIQDGILYVSVRSMSWRTELLFHKQAILDKISVFMENNQIKDIRFV